MANTRWNMYLTVLLCSQLAFSKPSRRMDVDHLHPRHEGPSRDSPREGESDAEFWNQMAQETLVQHLSRTMVYGVAKNVILFLGDGMSIATLTGSRIVTGGEQSILTVDKFDYLGLSKTYCVDSMVADSACSATAYLGGVKANIATIGVTAAVTNKDCNSMRNESNHVHSLLRKAQVAGKSTGFVTTTRITDASPAGTYAHTAERDWENDRKVKLDNADPAVCDDIAEQLIRGETGKSFQVMLGGGRANFRDIKMVDEEGKLGRRTDGKDLIDEWQKNKADTGASYAWVWDKPTFEAVDLNTTAYILGLFSPDDMDFNLHANHTLNPNLEEMTRAAIRVLSKNPEGYALFVEGGQIDSAHHSSKAQLAFDETWQFNQALQAAVDITDPVDTLIVVTSDHAHTMTISGYPDRGKNLLDIVDEGNDGLPITTINYANGPGYKNNYEDGSRYNVTNDDFDDIDYKYPALGPLESETHGGDDVAVFARGPWSHIFTGTYEQNFIHHAMCYAACLGDGLTACDQL